MTQIPPTFPTIKGKTGLSIMGIVKILIPILLFLPIPSFSTINLKVISNVLEVNISGIWNLERTKNYIPIPEIRAIELKETRLWWLFWLGILFTLSTLANLTVIPELLGSLFDDFFDTIFSLGILLTFLVISIGLIVLFFRIKKYSLFIYTSSVNYFLFYDRRDHANIENFKDNIFILREQLNTAIKEKEIIYPQRRSEIK